MKTLRVLSGLHAGAIQALPTGRYRIAASVSDIPGSAPAEESQITLFDWSDPPLVLQVDAVGEVAELPVPDAATPGCSAIWPNLRVRRFGPVVLCIGEADDARPPDTELLLKLPSRAPDGPRRSGSWGARAGFLGAGLLVAVSALYGRSVSSVPELPIPPPELGAELLRHSLASREIHELRVHPQSNDILLDGLVRTGVQGQAARAAVGDLERHNGITVVQQWEVADDIASTIEAALRRSDVHARYLGAGRFEVSGTVADPETLRAAIDVLRKDLGPNVKAIELALQRSSRVAVFSAAITTDGLRYSERPDGAKVFARDARGL